MRLSCKRGGVATAIPVGDWKVCLDSVAEAKGQCMEDMHTGTRAG